MLREVDKRSLINRIHKCYAIFFGHVIRREKLHLVTTRTIKGKCSRGKRREKMLDGITKWLKVGRVTDALKVTSDRDAMEVMIA